MMPQMVRTTKPTDKPMAKVVRVHFEKGSLAACPDERPSHLIRCSRSLHARCHSQLPPRSFSSNRVEPGILLWSSCSSLMD